MSSTDIVDLHIELPSFFHSFVIRVPLSSTVNDLKHHIFKTCVGAPQPVGQRLICKGRALLDHEVVQNIWKLKSADEPRVIHLGVHPSAWTSNPPELPQSSGAPSLSHIPLGPPLHPAPSPPSSQASPSIQAGDLYCLSYLAYKHRNALWALRDGRTFPPPLGPYYDHSRALCVISVAHQNWAWPAILDQDYPPPTPGGVVYDAIVKYGKPYLQCRDASAVPTPFQVHALKVLTYTFVLGPLPMITETTMTQVVPTYQVPLPGNVNAVLHQLGLPPIRVVPTTHTNPNPNPNLNAFANINGQPQPHLGANINVDARQNNNGGAAVPELREIPFRPLFAPLAMLAIRMLLLLYFVAPARKPVIGILILGWVVYEGWRPIRAVLRRGWGADAGQQQRQDVNGIPAPVVPIVPAPAGGQPVQEQGNPVQNGARQGPAVMQPNATAGQGNMLLDSLAKMNLEQEEAALAGGAVEEPGILRKLATFFVLTIVTMHPAVWDRRRIALSRREGRIRAEANVRERADESEGDERVAQAAGELSRRHEQRAEWVKRYIDRVRGRENEE